MSPTDHRSPRSRRTTVLAGVVIVALLVALGAVGLRHHRDAGTSVADRLPRHRPHATHRPMHPRPTQRPTRTPTTAPSNAVQRAYDRLSVRERVGQLFMFAVTTSDPTDDQLDALRAGDVGNVFLRGSSSQGVAGVHADTTRIAAATTHAGVAPFVSADQEGGDVQTLTGPGFDTMPTAVDQGELSTDDLRADARTWGGQLRAAGVTLDLAPVADVVPADVGVANDPIGYFHREYADQPGPAGAHAAAFVRGMTAAGVATSLKHFPGLGRATGNTDSDPLVTDPTTADDPLLGSFAAGLAAQAPMVMVSSAFYPHLDDGTRACFSPAIIKRLLRGRMGYDGVVVSDSFGSASLAAVPPGQRAVRWFRSGGTLLLDTGIDDLEPMVAAVLQRAEHNTTFARTLRHDVLLVLAAKQRFGLIGATGGGPE